MPNYLRNREKKSYISNTNRKIGMLTSNPLVNIPLSLLPITSAQRLSIWCMQEAVVIQWRFSMKQEQHYSNYNSMPKKQLSIAMCSTVKYMQPPPNHRSAPKHTLKGAQHCTGCC